ncbi:MAG TPA: helix-turn-helix domain-containing protein, partial [Chlamydiales bacterium]|nr:helix-turn-helix domain-containing protein [Chlamydiales bacterium]
LELAREKDLPPFAIFSDRSLFEMATYFPHTDTEFLSINGVGSHKLEYYGELFLSTIREFCKQAQITPRPKPQEAQSPRPRAPQPIKTDSSEQSYQLFKQGHTLDEIAEMRGFTTGTVTAHICKYFESGELDITTKIDTLVSKEHQEAIHKVIDEVGASKLTPIKQRLPNEISYDEIRFVVLMRKAPMRS